MIENNFATACNDIDENLFEDSYMLFSSKDFTKFNLSKCEYVYVHRYGKLHMFFGKVGDGLLAPFSAPFSFCRMSTSNVKYSEYLPSSNVSNVMGHDDFVICRHDLS